MIHLLGPSQKYALEQFALTHPFRYHDFLSIAKALDTGVKVWAHIENKQIKAALIEGSMAVSAAGEKDQLLKLLDKVGYKKQLILIGPEQELAGFSPDGYKSRREILMQVDADKFTPAKELSLFEIAGPKDVSMLTDLQANSINEEYGIVIHEPVKKRLERSVAMAVQMQSVAVMKTEDGQIFFQAQITAVADSAMTLSSVYTHPDFRRQGHARSCLSFLISRLLLQRPNVILRVGVENQPAIDLYRHMGFHTIDHFLSFIADNG